MWCVAGYDQRATYTSAGVGKVFEPSFSSTIERVAANRLRALAKTASKIVLAPDGWKRAFTVTRKNLKSFDILLKVDKQFILDKYSDSTKGDFEKGTWGRSMAAREKGYKRFRRVRYKNIKVADKIVFNPVDNYVQSLEARYGEMAIFMYNRDSPTLVGVVMRPSTKGVASFQAGRARFRKVTKEGKVEFSVEEFKETLKMEGKGLVEAAVLNG